MWEFIIALGTIILGIVVVIAVVGAVISIIDLLFNS